ncbi:MAG: hypothetical protein U9O94_05390 [Nanoarchaeota archaeon]|nr:hypothetical protein [Nanoarchaeota archaeon]
MKIKNMMLLLLITLAVIPLTSALLDSEKIYFIELEYKNGLLELADIDVITGYPTLSDDPTKPYRVDVLSVDNKVLYMGYFEIPNRIYAPPPQDGGQGASVVELDYLKFSISLPYNKEGSLIKISKHQEELYINAREFSMFCGDGICQVDETTQTCQQDCGQEIAIPEEDIIEDRETGNGVYIGLVLIGIMIVIWKYSNKPAKLKRKSKRAPKTHKRYKTSGKRKK